MARTIDILSSLLYYISRPIVYLLYFILILLHLIASPFIYLGHLFLQCFMLPVHIIAKFEALWKFLGTAVLIGALFGGVLFLSSTAVFSLLGLDSSTKKADGKTSLVTREQEPTSLTKGHTAATYRAARQRRKTMMQEQLQRASESRWMAAKPLLGMAIPLAGQQNEAALIGDQRSAGRTRPDLLSTTILEEMSSTSSV